MTSFERRTDFAEIARRNVASFFGTVPAGWRLVVGDFAAPDARQADPAWSRREAGARERQ